MLISGYRDDLCLDYANTLSWRGRAEPAEKLHSLDDLLDWARTSGSVGAGAARNASIWSRARSKKVEELFAEAIALREAIFRIFSAMAAGQGARDRDLAVLTRSLAEAPARNWLVRSGNRFAWRIGQHRPRMPDLLAPVLWSAGDLLIAGEHRLVRQCANSECLWLFVDRSKNATRRWCDMAACGNRAKAQRHYQKIRQD
ncbi:MAG: hypothetical protein F9K29_12465 [Hyphomicrobiaceae bacterium]|nr:MAG: hypothetical protein F9K29_12465 [Hyphomicrobiaceae bacterium]